MSFFIAGKLDKIWKFWKVEFPLAILEVFAKNFKHILVLTRVRRRSKNDWKWARISLYLIKKRVFMREMLHFKALEYLWECQNCICDVLLSSKLVLDLNLDQFWGSKRNSFPAGNWTPVSCSTGGILTTVLSRKRWCFAEFCKTSESITLQKGLGF